MSVVHENARCIDEEAYHRTIQNAMHTHTHTHTHNIFALSDVPNTREKPRTFELSFSHSSSPSAKSYTLPISNASGSSFRFSFSCLSVSRITFRCVFNCSFDCDIPPPLLDPQHRLSSSPSVRAFRSVPSLFSVTMSSSSNSTSRICFVPVFIKVEKQKESKSSLSDADE